MKTVKEYISEAIVKGKLKHYKNSDKLYPNKLPKEILSDNKSIYTLSNNIELVKNSLVKFIEFTYGTLNKDNIIEFYNEYYWDIYIPFLINVANLDARQSKIMLKGYFTSEKVSILKAIESISKIKDNSLLTVFPEGFYKFMVYVYINKHFMEDKIIK